MFGTQLAILTAINKMETAIMCARTRTSRSLRDIRNRFLTQLDYRISEPSSQYSYPGSTIPFVIKGKEVDRVLSSSTWGYPLNNDTNKYIYNARIENVPTKSFWHPYQNSRVLIPVTSFFEKDEWFAPKDHNLIALGGLYMRDTYFRSLIVCTTPSVQPDMIASNSRMPVVIHQDQWSDWLDPTHDINGFDFVSEGYIKENA
jgi:hypothetical protein